MVIAYLSPSTVYRILKKHDFIDEYSRYIVHHALLISMDADSVSLEAQIAIKTLRKSSLAEPVIQSDNGSRLQ
jgi:hypothetical protein